MNDQKKKKNGVSLERKKKKNLGVRVSLVILIVMMNGFLFYSHWSTFKK